MGRHRQHSRRITDRVYRLCASSDSVSSLLAGDPRLSPAEASEQLYGKQALKAVSGKRESSNSVSVGDPAEQTPQDDLERAARCGRWGPTRPSGLFLKIYHDALSTLDKNPLRGVVSPSLMGSYGAVPLTVISVMPDIVRHMSNVIVRAEHDVFLATNYWEDSVASKYITNALRELDRRAGVRGARIVLKILYDRGSPRQLYGPHYIVEEKEFTGKDVNLPHPSEIPNIDMEVMNFHTPLMGTSHAKYMVVDRRIALLQSNNIMDTDNLEMLIHLEGPIVDSLYDTALISWHKKLDPPLPTYNAPAAKGSVVGPPTTESVLYPYLGVRSPNGNWSSDTAGDGNAPATQARNKPVYYGRAQTHPKSPHLVPEHTAYNPRYDSDIEGEVARIQSSLAPKPGETHLQAVTRLLNHTVNEGFSGDPNAPECPPGEFMTPYIPHQAHTPYPMALVNRAPYGPPGHQSLSTPQNAAWLSALRNAQESVLIVSPTLNASPVIPAIREACERGVHVHCYISLGYNDAGELLPFQGGHNEKVAASLYRSLAPPAHARLHYHWYVAKDQTRPLARSPRRLRSSHVKLMVVDGRVAVAGNGNMDTQSWFHSQEVNLLVDSGELCREWLAALDRSQNTRLFGAVDEKDGVWRDAEGREIRGAMGPRARRMGWLRGVAGAVRRLRGTGGF